MKIDFNKRELQLIEHCLEEKVNSYFLPEDVRKEYSVLKIRINEIRFPPPKHKKGFVSFKTMGNNWVTFKVR